MKISAAITSVFTILWHINSYAIEKDNMHVFIGKLISYEVTKTEDNLIAELPKNMEGSVIHMDTEFTVKCKILKILSGSLGKDEVEFKVYGRFKVPPFSKFDHVLFFLTERSNGLTLVKHQYFDVYRTADKKWATCGRRDGYLLEDMALNIQSWPGWYLNDVSDVKIAAINEISYDIEYLNEDIGSYPESYKMDDFYPKKYFDISDGKANCKGIGISAEELTRDHKKLILDFWD